MRSLSPLLLFSLLLFSCTTAFTVVSPQQLQLLLQQRQTVSSQLFLSESDFSAFANSLEETFDSSNNSSDGNDSNNKNSFEADTPKAWQAKLETLLSPQTSLAQRQILASELLSSNDEIRESVMSALRDRKIDPLLTPTGKKLQDGTKAVARQLTTDIFPKALDVPSNPSSSRSRPPTLLQPDELLELVPKIGSRVLNALGNQARKNLETLQGDLADPSRIPQRLTQQTEELVKEARNVFLETPEGLQGPKYTVVATSKSKNSSAAAADTVGVVDDGEELQYEIRDYEGYTVASTTMSTVGEQYSLDDVASSGAAFNALAAYLFGANSEGRAMDMTTPVTTTSLGEMRFYLAAKHNNNNNNDSSTATTFPAPLVDDNLYDTGSIQLVDIPPTRLAVRKFTGFVTEGEVSRQKEVLLQALDIDGWELDVKHGAIVPHVIFQYNPPYTLPMIRRNEIAVPIQTEPQPSASPQPEVGDNNSFDDSDDSDVSPSDY